jgi:hypothetical protein
MRQLATHITNMPKFGILNIKKYHTMSSIHTTNLIAPSIRKALEQFSDNMRQGITSELDRVGTAVQRTFQATVNVISDATTTPCRDKSIGGGVGGVRGGVFPPPWEELVRRRCPQSSVTPSTLPLDAVTNRAQDGTNQETPQLPNEPCYGNEPTPKASSIFSDPTVTIPFTVVGCLSGGVAGAVTMDGVSKMRNSECTQKILQGFKIAAGIAAGGTLATGVSCLVGPLGAAAVVSSFLVGACARVAAHNHLCKRKYSAVSRDANSGV